jgi:hypothetical protein
MAVERFDSYANKWRCALKHDGAYGNRNYVVFAVLAGVRNRQNIKPISEPRGLPDDLSEEARRSAERGDHSHSWLLLSEVRAYDWASGFMESGLVDAYESLRLFEKGAPQAWCQGRGGKQVSTEEMKAQIARSGLTLAEVEASKGYFHNYARHPELRDLYVAAEWPASIKEDCGDFIAWLDALAATRLDYLPEETRLVFGFDS